MDTMLYINPLAQSYISIKDNTVNSYSPAMWLFVYTMAYWQKKKK